MSELNKETLKYLGELCRIPISDEEETSLLKDMQNLIDYVEQLSELNTKGLTPCNHVLEDMVNVMREDFVDSTLSPEELLANTPEHSAGMIKVPPIMKNHA